MSNFPGSPRLLKGRIVLLDPDTSALPRIIALQHDPDALNGTLKVQGAGDEEGGRLEALCLKGSPVEAIKRDAMMHATNYLTRFVWNYFSRR